MIASLNASQADTEDGGLKRRAEAAHRRMEPFDYHGVELNPGSMLNQVRDVRDEYLRVPDDDLLKPFRLRAGRLSPGDDLGGWYTDGTFHIFGQLLSGLARMYAGNGDDGCRQKLNALIQGWEACIEEDGYFFPTKPPRPAHYIYEKMVGGLLDAHLYGGNPEALRLLDHITGWAEKNLDHTNDYVFDTLIGITEWYTLPENLYRAAQATSRTRYRDFGRTWEYHRFWDIFARPDFDLFAGSRGYHAYSHVNSLNSAATAYGITGDRHYLEVVSSAYQYLQQHQVMATGGYGPAERLVPEDLLLDYLDVMENHWETACSSWAGFKLCKRLMCFTGDAHYGDWIERLLINGIGAALPMRQDGRLMYYSRHGLSGAEKCYNHTAWTCCAGSRIQAVADYHDLIFFKDDDSLYVNLFTPATVSWNRNGIRVVVRQETRFPASDVTALYVFPEQSDSFSVKLRTPAWLARPMEVSINGDPLTVETDTNHWTCIDREWKSGDRVEVRLPTRLALERFPRASEESFPAAIVHGPVVLASEGREGNPVSLIDFKQLEKTLVPIVNQPLTYRLAKAPHVVMRPFFRFAENEKYFLYFDPRHPWTRRVPRELEFSSGWNLNLTSDLMITSEVGSFVEHQFTGSAVRWIGRKFDDAGRAEVSIDGTRVGVVDQYDAVRDTPFRYEITDLSDGPHTIRVTLLEGKNPASKNRSLNIAGFDVIRVPIQTHPASTEQK